MKAAALPAPKAGATLCAPAAAHQQPRGAGNQQSRAARLRNRGGAKHVKLPVTGIPIFLAVKKVEPDRVDIRKRGIKDAAHGAWIAARGRVKVERAKIGKVGAPNHRDGD